MHVSMLKITRVKAHENDLSIASVILDFLNLISLKNYVMHYLEITVMI